MNCHAFLIRNCDFANGRVFVTLCATCRQKSGTPGIPQPLHNPEIIHTLMKYTLIALAAILAVAGLNSCASKQSQPPPPPMVDMGMRSGK